MLRRGSQPHLNEHRNRPNQKQRIERRVDALIEAEEHFDDGDQKGYDALARLERTVVLGSVIMKKMKS